MSNDFINETLKPALEGIKRNIEKISEFQHPQTRIDKLVQLKQASLYDIQTGLFEKAYLAKLNGQLNKTEAEKADTLLKAAECAIECQIILAGANREEFEQANWFTRCRGSISDAFDKASNAVKFANLVTYFSPTNQWKTAALPQDVIHKHLTF